MPGPTLKLVAILAGVAPTTVSRVVNGSQNVATETREKILAIIKDLEYTPNLHAANLRRKRMNEESACGAKGLLIGTAEHLRSERDLNTNAPCPSDGVFLFSPAEGRVLAEQIIRLRRDLDRLRKHTEDIQTCVDILQETYSRRPSFCPAH